MIETRQDDNTVNSKPGAIIARLLWKDACQAWPWYLLGALVAVAAIPWMLPKDMPGWQWQVRDYPWMLVTLAMSARGALLAAERNRQSYAVTHFSFHPERMPAFAFGLNLLGVLLLGLAVGGRIAVYRDPLVMAPVVLYFTAAFLAGYLIAIIFGKSYAGIVAGVPLIMIPYPMLASLIRELPYNSSSADQELGWYIGGVAGGLLAVAFLLLSARLPLLFRRSGMVLFMVLGLYAGLLRAKSTYPFEQYYDYNQITDQRLATSDGAQEVEYIRK